ncbi:MAG: hypothetical protein KGL39_20705 [Patescibacteria group bacterium]|nr:hypothetical protein [Patescibacteria group bacterium]
MYKFALLDPRPNADNSAIFTEPVLGIEVTIPTLAAQCVLGNLDPQHTEGRDMAAIEMALTMECRVPPDGATLATIRADLDSVGAMAVLEFLLDGFTPEFVAHRAGLVAEADRFARGPWPGPLPLPTPDDPWPAGQGGASDSRPLAAIAAAVADFKVPIAERVQTMRRWLTAGEEPASYREQVDAERADMVAALADGRISASTACGGRVAVVSSTHRSATTVGYCLAPVVIARNPAFRYQGGDPHAKFTVCQYAPGHCDLRAALAELQGLEPGWGGSPTIIGSPQGVGSTISMLAVLDSVARHLCSPAFPA